MKWMTLIGSLLLGWSGMNLSLPAAVFVRPAVRWIQTPMLKASWGQWPDYGSGGKAFYFQKLQEVGIQVYIRTFWEDLSSGANPEEIQTDARFCQQYGLRFLPGIASNTDFERHWARQHQVRLALNTEGKTSLDLDPDIYMPCPLAEEYWDFAYTQRALALIQWAQTEVGGIIGMHIDPEHYNGLWAFYRGPHTCYCDHCFGGYLRSRGSPLAIPPSRRYHWLKRHGQLTAYWAYLEEEARFLAQRMERRVHQQNPDFLFALYPGVEPLPQDWFLRGMARGLNTPTVPLLVCDASHYQDLDWSKSSGDWYRQEGMVHLQGHWIERIQQNCPQIPLSQIFAESGLHADGYWVWWEEPLTADQWNALAQANQWLDRLADRIGPFLRNPPDSKFVQVESMRDDLDWDGIVFARSFHLGERHLLQLSNISLEERATVRVRWPSLDDGPYWLVNPISQKAYAPPRGNDPSSPSPSPFTWQAGQLQKGVPVPLEPRSETFLLLHPATPQGPVYPLGGTADQVWAHWSAGQSRSFRRTAGTVRLSQPSPTSLLRVQTTAQEVWINPFRGGQVWRWHEKQNGNELVTYDHGGLWSCGLFKDVLLPGEAGLVEAAESYNIVSHQVSPARAEVVLERDWTPETEPEAPAAHLHVRKSIVVENAEPRLTVTYRLTNTGAGPWQGKLTLWQAIRLAEKSLRAAGKSWYEGWGLVLPTLQGIVYHTFPPPHLAWETRAQGASSWSGAGFAQFCPLTQEGILWKVNREQIERVYLGSPRWGTYILDFQPLLLLPHETWQTTVSIRYEPTFNWPREWRHKARSSRPQLNTSTSLLINSKKESAKTSRPRREERVTMK